MKIYAHFECNLRGVESCEGSCSKKCQNHVPCSFAYEVVCIDNSFSKQIVVLEVKMLLTNLLKQFLRSINIAKKVIKKHFHKNLIIRENEEHLFQQSNSC